MNLLFIGSPGSGKGTQARYLILKQGFTHISTGDIFRKNLKNKTELGLLAQKYMDQGDLVPDEVTIQMVEATLKDTPKETSIIFDGFPRNILQGKALDEILKRRGQKLDLVLYIKVPDEKIITRLTGRLWAVQSGRVYHIKNNPPKNKGHCDETGEALIQRKDDKKEVVLSRLKVFWENTHPLLDHYSKQGNLEAIDGEKSPDEVFHSILILLENYQKSPKKI